VQYIHLFLLRFSLENQRDNANTRISLLPIIPPIIVSNIEILVIIIECHPPLLGMMRLVGVGGEGALLKMCRIVYRLLFSYFKRCLFTKSLRKENMDFLLISKFFIFYFIFCRAYVAHFCIFERCLNSNPESCRSNLPSYINFTVCVHCDVCANVSGNQ